MLPSLLLALFPFSFLAVYCDAVWGTMLGYLPLIVVLVVLCGTWIRRASCLALILCNIVSILSSQAFAALSNLEAMSDYFKPLTSHRMILLVSTLALIVQMIAFLCKRRSLR